MYSEREASHDHKCLLEEHEPSLEATRNGSWSSRVLRSPIWAFVSLSLGLLIVVQLIRSHLSHCPVNFATDFRPIIPAIELIEYQFTGGLELKPDGRVYRDNSTIPQYVGPPSRDVDSAWNELLIASETIVHGDEADSVRGKTYEETDNPGSFRFTLDVYHSLHCVNEIRKALNNKNYNPKDHSYFYQDHLDHCIDYLRQTIQCQGDLTPLMFEFSKKFHTGFPIFGATHTCRNFSKIHEWALEKKGLFIQDDGSLSSHPALVV